MLFSINQWSESYLTGWFLNFTGFEKLSEKGTTLDCRNVFHMFHSNAQYKVILHLTITQYQLCNLGHFYLTPS